ncbi:TnsD family Tn7-like transposition protein [Aquitalea sp.]|uniref:TnsD family Tn7-like transposition protein n=1 Tax=Aquitalea sp. TaxID=1872623 RepID=UPI00258452D3|nr:TnsD family Tn7-like transposition protein [Aquitalea sp.]
MASQAELAGFSVWLEPLPNETLFSWCSRYHRLAANGLDRKTCLQLFGHHQTGAAHDFPARVGILAARTKGALGTASEIIQQRTLLPFYLPFRPEILGRQAEQALCGEGIGHLKYRLGLLTSGLGAAHPLKACVSCITEDLTLHGWAYWRRSHQLPGVWLCPRHHEPLQVSPLKLDQVARFSWGLPTQACCAPISCLEGLNSGQAAWLFQLGTLSTALLDCVPGQFDDPARISQTVRDRLRSRGMAHPAGRIRWSMVEPVLAQMAMEMACLPELNHQSDPVLLRNQLLRLLSGRALTHPLRYLLWIATWFDDLADFQRAYDDVYAVTAPVDRSEAGAVTIRHGPSEQQQVLLQANRGSISLSAAAKQAGVSYATMAVWASRQAIEPSRRPKKVSPSMWEQMVIELRSGAEKEAVALEFDVSVVTVTRILRTAPGLQDHWHAVKHEQRRSAARHAWEQIAGLHAYMGLKALRRLQPAAYAWLYRNDRDWLNACARSLPKRVAGNHAAKRIENADERMAAALKQLANHNATLQAWTLDALKRSIPRIEKAIHSPERWPLTIKALAFILTFTGKLTGCLDPARYH